MNIVYSMTRNVYEMILPSLRSLAEHNPDANVIILCEDEKLPFRTPLMKLECIDISNQLYFPNIGENRKKDFGGYINHLKVYYPDLLPQFDKIIHLDIDTIILDKLDDLWNTNVDGKYFAAVPESQTWYRPYGDTYYNMGVALINLAEMRKDDISKVMGSYLLSEESRFADQNAWNAFGYERKKATKLPLRFNESPVTGHTNNPAIVHYCSIPDWWTNKNMFRANYLQKYKEEMK